MDTSGLSRRGFFHRMAVGAVIAGAVRAEAPGVQNTPAPSGPFTLPPLPYAYDALEPFIDAKTMEIHHDKHHQAYVTNLNKAIATHPELVGQSVEALVKNLATVPEDIRTAVRNNGGGHANHSLFWTTLGKNNGASPAGDLGKALRQKFGDYAAFQTQFTKAALGVFGSGWAWLSLDANKQLLIDPTPNQDSVLTAGHHPLVGIDVWEHAYYLKYQNKRADYIAAFYSVINWDAANERYRAALG
ncbi:MAG TPA: superoxide dismutase [Terriglobia bacterium]|nr:superoxide dismutase [Terriglobia bacterium]